MKPFVFTMDRMRDYKEQLLDDEKGSLRQLRRHKDEIEQKIAELKEYRRATEDEFQNRQSEGVSFQELQSFQFCMDSSRFMLQQMEKALVEAEEKVECQLQKVVVASQEVSGLNKLEEKQQTVYRQSEAADTREFILEQVSGKEVRRQKKA